MNRKVYEFFTNKEHHKFRRSFELNLAQEYAEQKISPKERMVDRFEKACKAQRPIIIEGEQIVFFRTVGKLPEIFTEEETAELRNTYTQYFGYLNNVNPNYYDTIATGLLAKRKDADELNKRTIDAIIELCDRYAQEAQRLGRKDIVEVFSQIPRYGARNFREALQFFRVLHFSLWLEGEMHNTIGRFDKMIYPYLKKDMDIGIYTYDSALELVEDFFLSFCKDYDLYQGAQIGDNGQSMVLGGIDENGNDTFNLLSELCLKASYNNKLIDPKINLRVSSKTPMERFIMGTELTKAGLGFPQYSNDDVVIPALEALGYAPCDAANYVVAACWEFIIPNTGNDIVNIDSFSYPKAVDRALHKHFIHSNTYNEFLQSVKTEMKLLADEMCDRIKSVWHIPSPIIEILNGFDMNTSAKYNNFGFHGTGLATAADSLAAIKKYVYEEKYITAEELLNAVDNNFENTPELLHMLRFDAPKMGNNDNYVDEISIELMNTFADSLKGKTNCRGGIYRGGTGSAMNYLWAADEIGASPDGRRKGESLGANFSISLFAKPKGPISVIGSMTKQPFNKVINGGPLTLEFHKNVFSEDNGIEKVASLIKAYIDRGGHQLQLNTVSPDKMLDAQRHPRKL